MTKALITAAGPHMHEVLDCSEPTFQIFADQHGYELIIDRQLEDAADHQHPESRAARWAKLGFMRRMLTEHELVVWMDADVMITKFDKDIADDVPADCFQALVLEQFPTRFNPNTGVWAMRQTPVSFAFLDELDRLGPVGPIWADQSAVCTALGWVVTAEGPKITGAKPVHASEYLAGTSWLPPAWDPLGLASRWPSNAQHFAGMSNELRLPRMRALQTKLLADYANQQA